MLQNLKRSFLTIGQNCQKLKASKLHFLPQRNLILHEYQSAQLLHEAKIPILVGVNITDPSQAKEIAAEMRRKHEEKGNLIDFVVKAQVHAGGRGKGYFKESGLNGGVHITTSTNEVQELSQRMCGKTLITKQTGKAGRHCSSVFIVERVYLRREMYLGILLDRTQGGIIIVTSQKGGMSIEEIEKKYIHKFFISVKEGLTDELCQSIVESLRLGKQKQEEATQIIRKIYQFFKDIDASMIEINPLGLTIDQELLCCDAKINIDDNSEHRQQDLFVLEDITQKDWKEIQASKHNLNYIALDGNIGCMVNGAGLAMATMDVIKSKDGMPANFLDVGGKATDEEVTEALKILDQDPNVESILVNIFAGITKCDQIALGLIKGSAELGLKKPIVLRLKGTNYDKAKKLINDSGFNMFFTDDLDEAAEKAVKMASILRMAKEAKINISLSS